MSSENAKMHPMKAIGIAIDCEDENALADFRLGRTIVRKTVYYVKRGEHSSSFGGNK